MDDEKTEKPGGFALVDAEDGSVTRVPAPEKGVLIVLTHDVEDARALTEVLLRSANTLSAMIAAIDVLSESVAHIPQPATPEDESEAGRRAILEAGSTFVSLQQVLSRIYAEGRARIVSDVTGLRNIVLPNTGLRVSTAVADSASELLSGAVGLEPRRAEEKTGAGQPAEPLFIPILKGDGK